MKTVCVLVLGWILFDSALTFKNIMGMLLAVLGMVIYSCAVEADKKMMKKADFRSNDALDGEDMKLLKQKVISGIADSDLEK
jgi:hypothetical protein